jgi:hypothetical protein
MGLPGRYGAPTWACAIGMIAALVLPAPAAARPIPEAPSCSLFPADNPWNQRVDALPAASGSGAMLRAMGLTRLHADFSDADADGYGIPYNVVDDATATSVVSFDYDDESDPGPYPIPEPPLIEGGSDRHILMINRDSCTLHELFAAEKSGAQWHAGSGAIWNLSSNAMRPLGWTSADAAGLPILPGLARYEEIGAGGIDHALRITLPVTQRAYLSPARHYASSNTYPDQAPMGLRIRIKAGHSLDGYSPQTRAVLTAGKRYGFIVADNGSAGYVTGAPHTGWNDDDLHDLHDVPASAFEVVDVSSLPGTPARRTWNTRFRVSTNYVKARTFQTRAGRLRFEARINGRVVRAASKWARQGYVEISMRRVRGASYRVRML